MRFVTNAVRLRLHPLGYNIANFVRTLALPKAVEAWSLTSSRKRWRGLAPESRRQCRTAVLTVLSARMRSHRTKSGLAGRSPHPQSARDATI